MAPITRQIKAITLKTSSKYMKVWCPRKVDYDYINPVRERAMHLNVFNSQFILFNAVYDSCDPRY